MKVVITISVGDSNIDQMYQLQGTMHWFDTGSTPDFTAIRFFHAKDGWVAIPSWRGSLGYRAC
jgi:cupin superfamily acireductone dioxygenase involved in methionine salvage